MNAARREGAVINTEKKFYGGSNKTGKVDSNEGIKLAQIDQ